MLRWATQGRGFRAEGGGGSVAGLRVQGQGCRGPGLQDHVFRSSGEGAGAGGVELHQASVAEREDVGRGGSGKAEVRQRSRGSDEGRERSEPPSYLSPAGHGLINNPCLMPDFICIPALPSRCCPTHEPMPSPPSLHSTSPSPPPLPAFERRSTPSPHRCRHPAVIQAQPPVSA